MALSATLSCSKSFLDEKPGSFYSTSNAFKNAADFTASSNNLYRLVREYFYVNSDWQPFHMYLYRTDVVTEITVTTPNLPGEISPNGIVQQYWGQFYKIIAEANTIIGRIPDSELNDSQKRQFEAIARFFRAFGYRCLVYLYGGVPLVLEETHSIKTDYVRASKKDVLAQIIDDLKYAADNLPAINEVRDGEISNLVAQHLLAEVYITDEQYGLAITAASAVIDDPNTDLMTTRFGSRLTVTPGDVYWDLFQPRNQNRASGNREGLWVIQFETDVLGGSSVSTGPAGSYQLERVHAPLTRDVRINGVSPFLWPVGDYTGGRGVGFMAPSLYFMNDVWASDFDNDIRNANHNFVRDFVANNPTSPYYGQIISTRNVPAGTTGIDGTPVISNVPNRAFYPYQSKATTVFAHPADLYSNPSSLDPLARYELKASAGGTYTDQYMFRLAETYLLRAEAYLLDNQPGLAAGDINTVRSRANASAVDPADVDIDYILDERMREFGVEEKRMFTLMRMGKFYDRVTRFNPFYGQQMQPHFNIWPIPFSEIERNRTAKLEQNPGYPQ